MKKSLMMGVAAGGLMWAGVSFAGEAPALEETTGFVETTVVDGSSPVESSDVSVNAIDPDAAAPWRPAAKNSDSGGSDSGMNTNFDVSPIIAIGFYQGPRAATKAQTNFILGISGRFETMSRRAIGGGTQVFARYQYMFGSQRYGYDVDFGVRGGAKLGIFRLYTGVDFWNDRKHYGGVDYGKAWLLGIPILGYFDIKILTVYGGVIPGWFIANKDNRAAANYSLGKTKGFGDEFEYVAGVKVNLGILHLGALWRAHVASYGTQGQLQLLIGFGPGKSMN